ncbi:AHG_G0043670.mRNA.1.CDS.1 [Saccharomyces cerevisiae]|nr:AHG_G0043670.mRNA.1.CDS.1 [Saccharomyces cerevisiae]CAI6850548.1 AHG_G0043670.mRNA.1.CDS.1 [Saccharomyces cerevisiae]
MSLIAERTGFYDDLYAFVHNPSKVTWGTCAGMIYISQQLSNEEKLVKTLNLLKVKVKRNAFGRQAQSSTRICDFSNFIPHCNDFPATFIRAPVIEEVLDPEHVQVLYKLDGKDNGGQELIVAAKQKKTIFLRHHFIRNWQKTIYGFTTGSSENLFLKTTVNKRDV